MTRGKALNIILPIDLYNRMKEASEKKGLSLAALIRLAVSEYLERSQ